VSEAGPEKLLAREVRAWRSRRELTAQQLADQVQELGGSLSRQAISKLENGDRGVSIEELFLLARALRVPPVLLVLPLGAQPKVELLPGRQADTWDAVKWFTGDGPFPEQPSAWREMPADARWPDVVDEDNFRAYEAGATILRYYQDHDRQVGELRRLRFIAEQEDAKPTDIEAAKWAEVRVRDLRENMRRAGLLPPQMPWNLPIEEKEGGET